MMRKELRSSQEECKRLTKQTNKARRVAEEQNKEAINSMRIADEHMTQRIALRAKHDEDKEHFEQQIKIMQDKLTDRDETKDIEDKQADQNYEQANMDASNNGDYKNPMEILKMRLAKIIATNKEKNKLM